MRMDRYGVDGGESQSNINSNIDTVVSNGVPMVSFSHKIINGTVSDEGGLETSDKKIQDTITYAKNNGASWVDHVEFLASIPIYSWGNALDGTGLAITPTHGNYLGGDTTVGDLSKFRDSNDRQLSEMSTFLADDWGDNALSNRSDGIRGRYLALERGAVDGYYRPDWGVATGSASASGSELQIPAGDTTTQKINANVGNPPYYGEWEFVWQFPTAPSAGRLDIHFMFDSGAAEE